jgi:hypothetical protein
MNNNYGSDEWLNEIKAYKLSDYKPRLLIIMAEIQKKDRLGKAIEKNRIFEILYGEFQHKRLENALGRKTWWMWFNNKRNDHPYRSRIFLDSISSLETEKIKSILRELKPLVGRWGWESDKDIEQVFAIVLGEYCKRILQQKKRYLRNAIERGVTRYSAAS